MFNVGKSISVVHSLPMKPLLFALALCATLNASTISVVSIHEPISLHGTDVDDIISETGEALQATVISRPMALSGAFPEVLVDAIRTPHKILSNNPNYTVEEANLLILCKILISAETTDQGLLVTVDVAGLEIPLEVDITSRQLLKLTLVALRRTLEGYQPPQADPLKIIFAIAGTTEQNASLKDLQATFTLEPPP